MGLFDALSGKIEYFNSIVVPIHNEFGNRIKNLDDEETALFFAGVLDLIASKVIDYFFKSGKGNLTKVVKNYTIDDIKKLYTILIMWSVIDSINIGMDKNKIQKGVKEILNYSSKEFNDIRQLLDHDTGEDLYKLWEEIAKILRINIKSKEGYLYFNINYSRIAKQAYREMYKL